LDNLECHTLKLDLVLDNQRLAGVVNRLVELCGDGVVGSDIFDNYGKAR
jgi:hypothetical protein